MIEPEEIRPVDYYLGLYYPITIYRADEGGYVAEVEDLPGCITQGETLEEVAQRIDDARKDWIQTAYEDGVRIPLPRTDEQYSGKFMVRIPKYLHRRLAEQARREGASLNQYITSILSQGASIQNAPELITRLGKVRGVPDTQAASIIGHDLYRPFGIRWILDQPLEQFPGYSLKKTQDRGQVAV